MHALPGMQSLSVWHGQAHFWAATLQRWVRQLASTMQGRARGFGVDSALPGTRAVPVGTEGEAASTGVGVVPSPYPGAGVTGTAGVCGGA